MICSDEWGWEEEEEEEGWDGGGGKSISIREEGFWGEKESIHESNQRRDTGKSI